MKRLILLLWTLLTICGTSYAHKRGENYVFLSFHDDRIEGRFEFKVDEVKEKLGVDIYEGEKVSEQKMQATASSVHEYINENFSIGPSESETYDLKFTKAGLFSPEGGWAQYEFVIDSAPPPYLHIYHNMLYDGDPMHRGVVIVEEGVWPSDDYKMTISQVYSASNSIQVLDVNNPPETMTPKEMIWQGVLHIWIGIDHILFLVALALPIVLVRKDKKWEPAAGLRATLFSLLKVVTLFTIAHSITLALASLGLVQLPSRLVESVIALSIILIAVNNFIGRSQSLSFLVILVLGLFHGLGFASVMADLPFRIAELKPFLYIIVAFNVGVELGQVAILLVLFPLLFGLRKTPIYVPFVLRGGSAILVLIAGYWFIERAFAL